MVKGNTLDIRYCVITAKQWSITNTLLAKAKYILFPVIHYPVTERGVGKDFDAKWWNKDFRM